MSDISADLKFLPSHEWVREEGEGTIIIGISDYAQSELGDLVYVGMPELGAEVNAGDEVGVVESVKTASDLYAPVTGVVVAVNEELVETPELINQDPYGDGWMYQLKVTDNTELDGLLSGEDYLALIEED